MQSNYKDALYQIISFLERLEKEKGIKYYLVGGILVNLYSDFRTTRDIDLAIDFNASLIDRYEYVNLLRENDFFPYQDWNSTKILAKENNLIQFLDKTESVRYDNHIIIHSSKSKFNKIGIISLNQRQREKIFGIECWVASKEDFILSKLVYGGWQDYSDALGCWLRFNDELNITYLEENSKFLGIEKELILLMSGIDDPDEYFKKINRY
ncbi:MAG: hypothetical protein GF353_10995 [Candidatus Lokiarchaeota archaeon]|nr:hypothetical protein [Candidatus Lokiarchaeota archaeon]